VANVAKWQLCSELGIAFAVIGVAEAFAVLVLTGAIAYAITNPFGVGASVLVCVAAGWLFAGAAARVLLAGGRVRAAFIGACVGAATLAVSALAGVSAPDPSPIAALAGHLGEEGPNYAGALRIAFRFGGVPAIATGVAFGLTAMWAFRRQQYLPS
jgi:hypothetical protein